MLVAANTGAFQQQFIDGLHTMLQSDALGAFILVLANSMQDSHTRESLATELASAFQRHRDHLTDTKAPADDIAVFQQLLARGIDSLGVWQFKRGDDWLQILNPVRGLRPARVSATRIESIRKPFDNDGFHFNRAFLRPEILCAQLISNAAHSCEVRVLYNKFPFLPYHFLLVPEAEQCHPQYLTETMHNFVWQLAIDTRSQLPELGIGYNSVGACASVNHLHFQGFLYDAALPVEAGDWLHNGGSRDYPLRCQAFDDAAACWQAIDQCHAGNQPYNLLYRAGRCYLLYRKMQGDDSVAETVRGAGWIEMCGVLTESTAERLKQHDVIDMQEELASLSA